MEEISNSKNGNEELSPRSRLARAIIEVRRILSKDRLHVKKENARKELAQDLWKVRHILQAEGVYNEGVNRGLAEDISNFIEGHPDLYGKK